MAGISLNVRKTDLVEQAYDLNPFRPAPVFTCVSPRTRPLYKNVPPTAGNTPTLVTNLCRVIKDRKISFSPIRIRRSESFLRQLSDGHKDSFIRQLLSLNISNWIELCRTYYVMIRCWSVVTHGGTQYTYVVGRPGVVLKNRMYTLLGPKGLKCSE